MRRIISEKAVNKTVQYDNRLVQFLKPPIHTGELIVKSDLYVYGNSHLTNLDISGNLYVSGNVDISGNMDVSGNLDVSGSILASRFLPGQFVNAVMYNYSDLGQVGTIVGSGLDSRLFSISYTPKVSNSYLLIEYTAKYELVGGGNDNASAYLNINEVTYSTTFQKWIDTTGGGTRSGTIFPLMGRYTNSGVTPVGVTMWVHNGTDADTVTVYADNGTWLKITEIGR